jgi:hypothetical protein
MVVIMQGDEYPLRFKITSDEEPINIDDVEIVEIVIGNVKRKYPDYIYFDKINDEFVFNITQEMTFALAGAQDMQVRIKFKNSGWVFGEKMEKLQVVPSNSKEVL